MKWTNFAGPLAHVDIRCPNVVLHNTDIFFMCVNFMNIVFIFCRKS